MFYSDNLSDKHSINIKYCKGATSGEEVVGSILAVTARSKLVGSVLV